MREQRLKSGHLQTSLCKKSMIDINNVVSKYLYAECLCAVNNRFTNVAYADHAQGAFTESLARDLFPFAGFHLAIHPRLAAGESQYISQDRVRDREAESIQGAADLYLITGAGFSVDGIDARAPLGDHFQARRTSLDNARSITVISTNRTIKLACVFKQVGFFQALPHNGYDQFNIVFIEDWFKAIHDWDHIGSREEDFVFHHWQSFGTSTDHFAHEF